MPILEMLLQNAYANRRLLEAFQTHCTAQASKAEQPQAPLRG